MEIMLPQAPMLAPSATKIITILTVIYDAEISGLDTIAITCVPMLSIILE